MAKGISLHIGLNNIDTNKYKGKYTSLRNAERDAIYYYELAQQKNFTPVKLIGKDATSGNLLDHLKMYSNSLSSGDICFISYSGHGSRVKDLNNDEDDGYDEVLVLYDRLFVDDEFRLAFAKFKAGVKIFFINDSCNNGTVSRFFNAHKKAADAIYPNHVLRGIDSSQTDIDFENNISYFKSIKLGSSSEKALCSIIHISACQDNQLADDGSSLDTNGKFTSTVKGILTNELNHSYKSFYAKIKSNMPPWQSPNWDTDAGTISEMFEKSLLLSI